MELCLVRHAIAVERGSKGYQDDRARPLTPEGRKRMAQAALGLKSLVQPEAVLTSPILRAMKIDDRYAHGAVRFSLSRYTTDAEVDRALEVLPAVIQRLRAVLPVA